MGNRFTLDLTSRVALVTGSSRGIGRAVAKLLAAAGARVAVNFFRDGEGARLAVEEIRAAGGQAMAIGADVSDPPQARRLVEEVVAAWKGLDILINNAAISPQNDAGAGDLDTWDRAFAVNARGTFLVTEAALPQLEKSRGTIVFVSSSAAQRGGVRRSAYSASKGAVISYTKSLARDLGPRGIRINCVAPGWVDTDMSADPLADPEARRRVEATIPLRRVATAEDIAGPILFLVSDLARYVHGEVLSINGGSVLVG